MAVVSNGVQVLLGTNMIPSGYTLPTVTTFTDYEYTKMGLTLSVLKATVADATRSTTLTNIIENATIGLEKQIEDLMAAEFDDAANTITWYANLINLNDNFKVGNVSEFYTNVAASYEATVDIYIKVS